MPMHLPFISRLYRSAWLVLYVAMSWQLTSCHTTKQTTEDNVQLRSTQLHDISTHDLNLDIFDICQWDILDSAGNTTGSIVQNRHTSGKINQNDTTQKLAAIRQNSHKQRVSERNAAAIPDISGDWYQIILIVCACVMLMAIVRICKI